MQNSGSRIDPSDTALLFVDLQSGIVELSKTVALDRLAKGVLGLSRLCKIFGMPAIVSGVSGQNGTAPKMIPQLADGIGAFLVHERTTADSLRNEAIVAAVKATARQTLLISGVSSEVAVQLPALSAADLGYRVFIVVDACGGMSERTEQAAFDRIVKAGGNKVSVMGLAGELADEGVAQGSCLSPLLCNLLLSDFDQKMNGRGITTIRYIDDILFLGKDASTVFKAFTSAQMLLGNLNLECYDPRKIADRDKSEQGPTSRGFEFLGCEIESGTVRPSSTNRRELLTKISDHFRHSLNLVRTPHLAFKRHATYAETLTLVSQTVQGWANTFGFCTDDRVMGSLDKEISVSLRKYSSLFRKRLRALSEMDNRRAMGVFSIADRKTPVGGQLMRSLPPKKGR